MRAPLLVRILANSFLSGPSTLDEIISRASLALGKPYRWLRPLARRYLNIVAGHPRPRHRDVVQFIFHDPQFRRIWSRHQRGISIAHFITGPQPMQPVAVARNWPVLQIESVGALAEWLQVTPTELEWLADLKGLTHKKDDARLRHYHYRVLAKQSGNIRLIESPKPRLKNIQRRILDEILGKVPPHDAVHGFVKERSIITFAAPHTNKGLVLRMDLRDFSPLSFAPEFRQCSVPSGIQNLSLTCLEVFAQPLLLAIYGRAPPSVKTRFISGNPDGKRRPSIFNRTSRRVRPLHQHSRISAPTILIVALLAWPDLRAPRTRATQTILLFPVIKILKDACCAFPPTLRPWPMKRASKFIIGRHVSCDRVCASTWPELWSTST